MLDVHNLPKKLAAYIYCQIFIIIIFWFSLPKWILKNKVIGKATGDDNTADF